MRKILQILPLAAALPAAAQLPPIPPGRLDAVQSCLNSSLYLHSDGNFYGTTQGEGRHPQGGFYCDGTIFKISPEGKLSCAAVFPLMHLGPPRGPDPSGLVPDDQGRLWGVLSGSGAAGCGTVYRFDPGFPAIKTVVDFTGNEGAQPGKDPYPKLVHDGHGWLWGVTRKGGKEGTGTAFKLNTRTGKLTCLTEFNSDPATKSLIKLPTAGTLSSDGKFFWGALTSPNQGSIFRLDTSSGANETIAAFTGSGAVPGRYPGCGVVSDGLGSLWGTTLGGGKHDHGTVFKIDEKSWKFTSVVQFGGENSADAPGQEPHTTLVSDGKGFMWGTTDGGKAPTIFRINIATGEMKRMAELPVKSDGSVRPHLYAPLTPDGKGALWGTTSSVPSTVFKIDTSTGKLTTVVEFPAGYGKDLSR